MTPTNEQITAAARALSNDNADTCNVNREDNWNLYGDSFRETARVALEAAMGVALTANERTSEALLNMSDALAVWRAESEKYHAITSLAISAFSDGYEAGMRAITNTALSANTETCKCRRLGDFDGFAHHPLCDKADEGQWVHCSPTLINAGVSCANTPRRACECVPEYGGHDHFIAHTTPPPATLSTETVDKGVDRLTDWRDVCAALIDVYDDAMNNAPEDRCYVDGAWKEELDQARALLASSATASDKEVS